MRTRENKCQISQIDILHMTIVVTILVKSGLQFPGGSRVNLNLTDP